MMRIAERVRALRVLPIGRQAIVHRPAQEFRQYADFFHRFAPTLLMHRIERQVQRASHMQPETTPVHIQARLVEVRHLGLLDSVLDHRFGLGQLLVAPPPPTAPPPGPSVGGPTPPSGNAPLVSTPQPGQHFVSTRCSTTRAFIGGTSPTCRRSRWTAGTAVRLCPQSWQRSGAYTFTSSGSFTRRKVLPGCPGWPPGLRPLGVRWLLGWGLMPGPSDEGGLLLLWLFVARRARSPAFSSSKAMTRRVRSATSSPTSAMTASGPRL